MFTIFRKYLCVVAFASLSCILIYSPAHATQYTIDAVSDAGSSPGQPDIVDFLLSNGSTVNVPSTASPFVNANSVFSYAANSANDITPGWTLQSAGNIWNSSATTVGVTTQQLAAGTYQVSVAGGAFTYDSFNWSNSPDYYQQWLWFLNIGSDVPVTVNGVTSQSYNSYTLGSTTLYSSSGAAFLANQNASIDITLANQGYLTFWIYDTDSIDNAGSLQVNLAAVPLPSSLLLLITGVPVLMPRIRQLILG